MTSPKKNALNKVLARASRDREFRTRLLASPTQTLAEMLGTLPRGVRVKFIEKPSEIDALIVLPDLSESGELSPSELEAVAGGEGLLWDEGLPEDDEPV